MPDIQLPAEIAADQQQVQAMRDALRIRLTDDERTYEYAVQFVADRIHPGLKRIKEWFKPLTQKAFEAHRALTTAERDACKPYEEIKSQVDREATAWRREQQRKRDAQLAIERQEAEQRARDEQAQAVLDAIVDGDDEAAEHIAAAPVRPIPAPSIAPVVPKVAGVSAPKRWKVTVDDPSKLLRWIAEQPEARGHFVEIVQSALDKLATAQRSAFCVPGCTAAEVESTQFRSAR